MFELGPPCVSLRGVKSLVDRLVDKILLKSRTRGSWLRLRNLGGGSPLFLRTCVG